MSNNEALSMRLGIDELPLTALIQDLAGAATFDPGEDVVSDPDDYLWEKSPAEEKGPDGQPDRGGDREPDCAKSN